MRRHDFAYDLPPDLIAQTPLAERSASRLLILDAASTYPDKASAHRDEASTYPAEASTHPGGVSTYRDAVRALREEARPHREGALGEEAIRHPQPSAVAPHARAPLRDCTMRDFPALLRRGDLLVFNDTKVVAARLAGTKPSGGRVEIFLERVVETDEALVQLRASKPIREGLEVTTAGGVVRVLGREDDLWRVKFPGPALEFFERWGDVPLPPYIHRTPDGNDRERYQSIFARERGAVAAPTASLHFDPQLMQQIEESGVDRAFITLHVGAGTFQPLRTEDLDSHVMHAERVTVSAATWKAIEQTRARGGRVIAIGTTVVRALESAARELAARDSAAREPAAREGCGASAMAGARSSDAVAALPTSDWSGETRLFIRPGFTFQVVDALLTNFHLPESTLLMLVCAFAGSDPVLAAYRHAVQARYRFFSYGDAMFLTRSDQAGQSGRTTKERT